MASTKATRVRIHREWFRTVSLGGRKSCPSCKSKLKGEEQAWIWSWGEYVRGKWYTVQYFCKECYPTEVQSKLTQHAKACGCQFELVAYHGTLPEWLTLEKGVCNVGDSR